MGARTPFGTPSAGFRGRWWVATAENPTVQVALEKLQSGYYVDYSLVLAGTTLATIPILIVFVLLGRQIVAGIMQGAVKG